MNDKQSGYSGAVTDTLTAEAHLSLLATFSPRAAAQAAGRSERSTTRPGDLFSSKSTALADWIESETQNEPSKEVGSVSKIKRMLQSW